MEKTSELKIRMAETVGAALSRLGYGLDDFMFNAEEAKRMGFASYAAAQERHRLEDQEAEMSPSVIRRISQLRGRADAIRRARV